jgi:hypothetical protein
MRPQMGVMPFIRRDFVQTVSVGAALSSLLTIAPARAASTPPAGQVPTTVNLDDRITCKQQLEHNIGPVVLMSTFLVLPDQVDNFLEGFKKQFAIMRKPPGLISAQLHRGIAGSSLFMNLHRLGIGRRLQARLRAAGVSGAAKTVPPGHRRLGEFLSKGRHSGYVRWRANHRRAVILAHRQ